MVAKLLGDPTYFPIEFRRWVRDFIENSDIEISQSQIIGGSGGGGSTNPTNLPAGVIIPFAGSSFPKDALACNGTAYKRADYPDLFTAIGTTWQGSSNPGSDMFRVPDLRDRALYGAGSVVQLGQTDGRSTGNRGGPNHQHNLNTGNADSSSHSHGGSAQNTPNHDHGPGFLANLNNFSVGAGPVGITAGSGTYGATSPGGSHGHGLTITGGNHGHSLSGYTSGGYDTDKPSFAGVTYIITTGIVPAT